MVVKYFHRSVDLVNSVSKRITSNELIKKGDRVLLSISGGQDSICLLFLLNHFYAQMELHLALFWCHHLWQSDSFSLMRQIAKLSFLFQLNGYFAISPNFIPSELLARHWRHNCNYRVCFFYNYYKTSLAHSANDKVETIFLNLMRGTGLAGLFPLRWTQLVSKKRVQNEEHTSQFSTFLISPFFWYTSFLASFPYATSFKRFRQHTQLLTYQREGMPIPLQGKDCYLQLHTEGKGSTNKKASHCYYFSYAYLKGTNIYLLHRTSSTFDMQRTYFFITLLAQHRGVAGIPYNSIPPVFKATFGMRVSASPKSVLPSRLILTIPSDPKVRIWKQSSPTWDLRSSRRAASQKPYSSSFSYSVKNKRREDPSILKRIVFKKDPQKFKYKSKKIAKKTTAKKWFCFVSYTFLKVCC